MSRTKEIRHISWKKTSSCKCRLDASVCNNKHLEIKTIKIGIMINEYVNAKN